jgi:hypothetical protein
VDVPTVIPKSPRKLESRSLSVWSSDSEAKHLYGRSKNYQGLLMPHFLLPPQLLLKCQEGYGELLGKNCKHKIK